MGCCASVAEDVGKPKTVKVGQISSHQREDKIQQDTEQREHQSIEPHKEIEYQFANMQQEMVEEKQICKQISMQSEKKVKEQKEELNPEQVRIRKFVEQKRQQYQQRPLYSLEEEEIIQQIEIKIYDRTLDLDFLDKLSHSSGRSIIDILFLITNSGSTLIELILSYIDNYDIITELLQDYNLPKIQQLEIIAQSLFQKIKPFKNNIQKINQSILFLQKLSGFPQARNLVESLQLDHGNENNKLEDFVFRIDTYIDLTKREQLKLLKQINQLFQELELKLDIMQLYKTAKQNYNFSLLKVSKKIPLGESNVENIDKIVLKELKFNIFHQIALDRKWEQFLQYSNQYYQLPSISEITPFMMLFQNAPLTIIIDYIQKFPQQLHQGIQYSTCQGLNLIHCLCMNKQATSQFYSELDTLIISIKQYSNIQQLLVQPYQEQIPLVFYLDSKKNKAYDKLSAFLSYYVVKEFDFKKMIIWATIQSQEVKNEKKYRVICRKNLYRHVKSQKYLLKKQQIFLKQYETQYTENEEQEIFYLHYIQLAKQIIIGNCNINISWINKFIGYSSYFPYDIGTTQQSLLNIMIRHSQFEQILQQLQYLEDCYNFEQDQSSFFNNQVQYLAKLISLKKELHLNPNENITNYINNKIITAVTTMPQLLITPIVGNHDFHVFSNEKNIPINQHSLVHFDTIYTLLLQLNDQQLISNCTDLKISFENQYQTSIMILKQLFDLKIISKLNDPFILKLLDYVQKECDSKEIFPTLKSHIQYRSERKQYHNDKLLFSNLVNQIDTTLVYSKKELSTWSYCKYFAKFSEKYNQEILQKIWFLQKEINFLPENLKNNIISQPVLCLLNIKGEFYEDFYNWQMLGIKFKIMDQRKKTIQIKQESIKQKVITYQLLERKPFIYALSVYPESFDDFKKFCQAQENQDQLHIHFLKDLPIKDIIRNDAFDTLKYCLQQFELSRFQLVLRLSASYFSGNSNIYYGKQDLYEKEIIQQFQESLTKLLMFLQSNCPYRDQEKEEEKEDKLILINSPNPHYLKYLDLQIFKLLKDTIPYRTYSLNLQVLKNINLASYIKMNSDKNIQSIIIDDYCSLPDKHFNIRDLLSLSQINSFLAKHILEKLKGINMVMESYEKKIVFSILVTVFQDDPNTAIDFLFEQRQQLVISSAQFQYLYQFALQRYDLKYLNKLLYYFSLTFNLSEFRLAVKTISVFNVDNQFINYHRALIFPYCSVLSLSQYQSFLEMIHLEVEDLVHQLIICFRDGLFEKLELIISKIGSFQKLSNKEQFVEKINSVLKYQLLTGFEPELSKLFFNETEEEEVKFRLSNKPFSFFQLPQPYIIKRKQLKQKQFQTVLQQKAKETVLSSLNQTKLNLTPLQIFRKEESSELKLFFEQERNYSKQNDNKSSLFVSSMSQNYDHNKCFEIISKWVTIKKMYQLSSIFELFDALKHPEAKLIKMNTEIKYVLTSLFQNKLKPHHTIQQKNKDFVKLLSANYSKAHNVITIFGEEEQIQVKLSHLRREFQEYFIADLIVDNSIFTPTQEDLEYIIVQLQYQNQKLLPLLRKKFRGLSLLKFNAGTLFYAKKDINLLPEATYDLEKYYNKKQFSKFKSRLLYFAKYISGVGANLGKLTSPQVFLIHGKHDHLINPLVFSYENLILALISGNINSILYILNLNLNPKKIALEQNVFQLLITRSFGDSAILNYFTSFVQDFIKTSNRILFIENCPLLYYIILTKRQRLFSECYVKFLSSIHGEQKSIDIIKQELKMKPYQDDIEILQLALKKKCYFILDYCDGLLEAYHLDSVDHVDIQLLQDNQLEGISKNSKQYQFLKMIIDFLPLCCAQDFKFQEFKKKIHTNYYEITKSIYVRDKQLEQLILLEKACLNQMYNIGSFFFFKNPLLSLRLSTKPMVILNYYQFNPNLLEDFLNKYKQDGLITLSDESYKEIIEKCLTYNILDHKIFIELAQAKPLLFFKLLKPLDFTLPIAVALLISIPNSPELKEFILLHQSKYYEKKQSLQEQIEQQDTEEKIEQQRDEFVSHKVIFTFYLLLCIQEDKYDKFLINELNLSTIQKIYELLQIENPSNRCKPKLSENAITFLLNILPKSVEILEIIQIVNIIESENNLFQALLKGIIFMKQIEYILNNFLKKLKDEITTMNNFSQKCQMYLDNTGNKKICYEVHHFLIPMQFNNDQFYLDESLIDQLVPELKMMNYQMNIDVELVQFQIQQEDWEQFDFSSITTIDFKEIILTSKESIMEKCLFFKDLMKQLDKVGLYQIDDVFAPHQHEQVRQPDLMHQTSQINQQPSLIHQQTSQIAMSTSQQPTIQSRISATQQQIMKEDFQFMFELLPDNTYQVRQQRKKKNQKELIFAEFYNFIQPKVIVNLEKLTEADYLTVYNGSTIISVIITDFYNYNEFLANLIDEKPQQNWVITFPFYIKNNSFIYQEQLFSTYNIQMIFQKLVEFIEKVKQLLGRSEDASKIVWRINTISFLEVLVSKLVELEPSNSQLTNIYALIEKIFSWESLIMILHQLLYNNLVKAQQVLKVIRGVYIEFNESQDIPFILSDKKKGLDRIFQFGNTTYLLYNHILIIRLNVGIFQQQHQLEQVQQKETNVYRSVFKPDPIIQEYFHNIINEYDFYNQIFTPEQLVQFLFNKLEIDRQLLNYSNQLSKILNKTITLSVDHSSLASIFEGEISKINKNKKDKNRLRDMEQIWYILQKLNKYFKDDLLNYLQKQLKAEGFDEMFNIRLYCLLLALRQNVPLMNVIVSNTRLLQVNQKSAILQKLCNVTKGDIKLSYQFGFQLIKNYFVNNSKLGDICIVLFCEKQKNNLIACQLVYNQKPGYFLFCKLDSLNQAILTQERITRNQGHYQTIKVSNSEFLFVQIEDLTSIIIFQAIWPSDPVFNSSILNVFFTDSDGVISLCNEPKFLAAMSSIQSEQDDFTKQEKLDSLFGPGLVSSYSDLSLTQLTPIFPDQINFDFSAMHQLKKQQSMVQGQNVYVRINGDKFKLDPIEITQVSMACHFQTNAKAQEQQKQFLKFLSSNQELQNINLVFDDALNANPNSSTDNILNGNPIFQEFESGYLEFKVNQYYPKLNNSLQYIFQIQSIQEIKMNLIKSAIQKVEFIFKKTYGEEQQLIEYNQCTLRLYTLIDLNENVTIPDARQIVQFLFNLILNFENYDFKEIITGRHALVIDIPKNIQIENSQAIADIILIARYCHELILMQEVQATLKVKIYSKNEILTEFRNTIYQFSNEDELIINYDTFNDFSLGDFFLDYLNNKQFHIKERYNDKIQYIGPQVIVTELPLNPQQLLSNVENETEIIISVYELGNQVRTDLTILDPAKFDGVFLVFKVAGIYKKMIGLKSSNYSVLQQHFKQSQSQQAICTSFYMLINNIQLDKGIDSQLAKIEASISLNNNITKDHLGNLLKKQGQKEELKIKSMLITNNVLLVIFYSEKTQKITLTSNIFEMTLVEQEKKKQIVLEYFTLNTQDLTKTTHSQVTFNGQTLQLELEAEEQVNFGVGHVKLMKILMKKDLKKSDEILLHKNYDSQPFTKEMQVGNTINMLSKQELRAASRAGQKRIDLIEFKDNLGNKINNFSYLSLILVHSLYPQVQYIPQQERVENGLNLTWNPIVKGVYKLFIDDIRIKGRFIVLANSPGLQQSEIEMPQQFSSIPFYEIIPFTFQLRDEWTNIYGDIESETFADCKCEIRTLDQTCKLSVNFSKLNKGGQMNATIFFEPLSVESKEENIELFLQINKEIKASKLIKLSGICLEKRRKKFESEIDKSFKRSGYNLIIRRMNFLQDLLELADKKMNYSFSIKFQDEPGIDAGGLKREFYDMIGDTLKDDTYKFFQPVQSNLGKYFLHSNFNRLKNKEKYALLFGKVTTYSLYQLVANAIGNGYLIGIDIISPFWKVVYEEQIEFEDLKIIWDKQTYENYDVLKSMSTEMLESLYLDFTYQVGNNTVELIPNGSKVAITKINVESYLDKTAEYVIHKQFSTIYKSFIEGFTSVLDLNVFKKWLRPFEISLLIQGLLDIKPDVILSKLTYSGGKSNHKSFFETYVNQADSQTLKNMLKFITGSSAIPFDQSSYIISVEFKSNLDIRKLPLAHTCFKSIEVPLYTSYAQLKQKLDIAFTIGLEGYGFG